MKAVTRQKYIHNIKNIERAFLIKIKKNNAFLLSDMEYGGEYQNARLETMCFKMDPKIKIEDAVVECRGYYAGGIEITEYNNEENSEDIVINDFLYEEDNAEFLLCSNNKLSKIIKNHNGKYLYIYLV